MSPPDRQIFTANEHKIVRLLSSETAIFHYCRSEISSMAKENAVRCLFFLARQTHRIYDEAVTSALVFPGCKPRILCRKYEHALRLEGIHLTVLSDLDVLEQFWRVFGTGRMHEALAVLN